MGARFEELKAKVDSQRTPIKISARDQERVGHVRGGTFQVLFLFSNSSGNFINILFKILNQITKWLILFGKPPSFKRNLGRFVGLKDHLKYE